MSVILYCKLCGKERICQTPAEARRRKTGYCIDCMRKNIKHGEEHPLYGSNNNMWKDDDVGYFAVHGWIKRYFPKPDFCQNCKTNPPCDLANISGEYKRDLADWKWLCRRCHMIEDGRMKNLKQYAV